MVILVNSKTINLADEAEKIVERYIKKSKKGNKHKVLSAVSMWGANVGMLLGCVAVSLILYRLL